MNTTNLGLAQKEKIEYLRKKYNHRLSSHAFNSLYLWRKQMGIELYLGDDIFSAKCRFKGENAWFFPCGDDSKKLDFISGLLDKENLKLCYMREQDKAFLQKHFPDRFRICSDENSDEYIYDIAEHMELSGKNYANVRTQLHRVMRDHSLRTVKLTDDAYQSSIDIVRDWAKSEHNFENCVLCDDYVDEEALSLCNELGIIGVVVFVDEVCYAVCAGFMLTDDTFDICLAKNRDNLPGLSYYAKRELMAILSDENKDCKYINLEEDLGISGLREMKQILHPVDKNIIWEATALG